DQTLRVAYNLTRVTNNNLGVGGYDEPERAYSTGSNVNNVRVQHFGPLGRRAVWRSRLQLFWSDADTQSATEAPTIRVLDAFTSGGAQLSGGGHSRRLNLGSDLVHNVPAFLANEPSKYKRRVGDANIAYQNLQGVFCVQDDRRVRKNLPLSANVIPNLEPTLQILVGDIRVTHASRVVAGLV